jgi:hypothetical protein
MKLSFAVLAAAVTGAAAFAPSGKTSSSSMVVRSEPPSVEGEVFMPPPLGPTLNGWTPDASKPCYGLPGVF